MHDIPLYGHGVCVCVCVCISCPHMHPILKSQTYKKAILMLVVYKFHHFYFDGKAVTVWEELGSLKNEYVKKNIDVEHIVLIGSNFCGNFIVCRNF